MEAETPKNCFGKAHPPSTFQCRKYYKVQHKLAIINTSTVKYTMYEHEALRLPPEAKVKKIYLIVSSLRIGKISLNFFLYISISHC